MESFEIKEVTLHEIDQLQQISRQTFTQTFSSDNSEEDMRLYLEKELSREKLIAELVDNNSSFFFAVLEGKVIGYLKLNHGKAQTELQEGNTLEIERIYVLQEFHGSKIGQKLYMKAMEIAEQKDIVYVWLGVWEKNPRAIRFYEKNGFKVFDKHLFKLGNDEQTDIMMKLQMRNKSDT